MNVRHVAEGGHKRGSATTAARRAVLAVAVRPRLWWPAVTAATRFAPRGWWRRRPFLPVPDDRYWRFRMETAYGDDGASPSDEDVVEVLQWSQRLRTPRR